MSEIQPIFDPNYWSDRLAKAKLRHEAVFKCPLEQWQAIEAKHREILAGHIRPHDSILDAGCGWGRLLGLLPDDWEGMYLGVDLSPDFVALARKCWHDYPHRERALFYVGDLRDLSTVIEPGGGRLPWAVCVSVRPMVRRNLGEAAWQEMEAQLRRVVSRILFLEYDPNDTGEVVECT